MNKDKERSRLGKYLLGLALSLDQMGAALRGWDHDETISSMLGKLKRYYGKDFKRERPVAYRLAKALNILDDNHVESAIEEDEGKNAIADRDISFKD